VTIRWNGMKILLVDSDPHPEIGKAPPPIAAWYGKEIQIGHPIIPSNQMPCGTHTLWLIIGPPEFLEALAQYGRIGRYVCIHSIITEVLAEEVAP
jgi:hypothetical protein